MGSLPKRTRFLADLTAIGVTDEAQQDQVVRAVVNLLTEWRDYLHAEYVLSGSLEDAGSANAFAILAALLLRDAPYTDEELEVLKDALTDEQMKAIRDAMDDGLF